jgi:hypothetical protein
MRARVTPPVDACRNAAPIVADRPFALIVHLRRRYLTSNGLIVSPRSAARSNQSTPSQTRSNFSVVHRPGSASAGRRRSAPPGWGARRQVGAREVEADERVAGRAARRAHETPAVGGRRGKRASKDCEIRHEAGAAHLRVPSVAGVTALATTIRHRCAPAVWPRECIPEIAVVPGLADAREIRRTRDKSPREGGSGWSVTSQQSRPMPIRGQRRASSISWSLSFH